MDAEFVRLLHEVHADEIPGHLYRGYSVLGAEEKYRDNQVRRLFCDNRTAGGSGTSERA